MGARSYIPQLGRFLQTDPVPGGSANSYAYTYGDPVNSFDPSGEYSVKLSKGAEAAGEEVASEGVAKRQAAEEAARLEAERNAAEAAEAAALSGQETEGPEEEWEEESEGGIENAAFGPGPGAGKLEVHLEEGVLYRSLEEETNGQPISRAMSNLAVLCRKALHSEELGSRKGVAHEACVRYADLFSEAEKALKSGWHWIKKAAAHVYHEGVKVWNWLRQKECERSQRVGCRVKNVASNCEVTNTALFIGSFIPESAGLSWLMRAGGAAGYASC